MMSERNVTSLHAHCARAPKVMRRFSPTDLRVGKVGHFGFFRREMARPAWEPHLVPELAVAG